MRKDYTDGSDHPVTNEHDWLVREFHNQADHSGYWDECGQPRCVRARAAKPDARFAEIEEQIEGTAGTGLQRALMDNSLVVQNGLEPDKEKESTLVWSLAIGKLFEPKKFIYGLTVDEVFVKALKWVKER